MANRTRRKTYCGACGRPIFTSVANPREYCDRHDHLQKKEELEILEKALVIVQREARESKCSETQECANILDVIVGDRKEACDGHQDR